MKDAWLDKSKISAHVMEHDLFPAGRLQGLPGGDHKRRFSKIATGPQPTAHTSYRLHSSCSLDPAPTRRLSRSPSHQPNLAPAAAAAAARAESHTPAAAAAVAAADDDGGAFELMARTFMEPSDLICLHSGTSILPGFRVSNACSHTSTRINIGSRFYQLVS